MAKTNAPLLSMGAAGQIGKSQVYATWRGVGYVRRHVVPANPKTSGQKQTRSVFSWCMAIWKLMASDAQAPWTANAKGRPFTNRNKFASVNVKALRGETDLTNYTGSPGANGGLPADSMTPTGGTGTISVTFTAPTLPTGWTLTKAVAVAQTDENPQTATEFTTFTETADATPWTVDFSDLDAGDYHVSGWFEMTKPDGSTAYGPSLEGTATVTA